MNAQQQQQLAEWKSRKHILKRARRAAGLGIYELSKDAEISPVTLSGFERGVSVPTMAQWVRLCAHLPTLPGVPLLSWVTVTNHDWKLLGWQRANVQIVRPAEAPAYALGRMGARLDYDPDAGAFAVTLPDGTRLEWPDSEPAPDPLLDQFGQALRYVCAELQRGAAAGFLPFINGVPTVYIHPDDLRAWMR